MRLLLLGAALLCSFNAVAAYPPSKDTAYMPKPAYPAELVDVVGDARISLNIHNDGSVTDVKVLSATREAFGVAAQAAAEHWRFEPWKVTADAPAVVDAQNTMIFSPAAAKNPFLDAQSVVHNMLFQPCSALNEELALFRKRYPKQPLSSAPTFAKTSAALLLPVFASQPDSQKGMTLNHQLIDALPDIARRCQEQPARMYSSVLPKDLQKAFGIPG